MATIRPAEFRETCAERSETRLMLLQQLASSPRQKTATAAAGQVANPHRPPPGLGILCKGMAEASSLEIQRPPKAGVEFVAMRSRYVYCGAL